MDGLNRKGDTMQTFNIYLNDVKIDSVFYMDGFDTHDVRRELIFYGGYDPDIKVVREDDED